MKSNIKIHLLWILIVQMAQPVAVFAGGESATAKNLDKLTKDMETENATLSENIKTQIDIINEQNEQITGYEKICTELFNELESYKKIIETLRGDKEKLEADAQQNSTENTAKIKKIEEQLEEVEKRKSDTEKQLAAKEKELQQANLELSNAQRRIQEMEEAIPNIKKRAVDEDKEERQKKLGFASHINEYTIMSDEAMDRGKKVDYYLHLLKEKETKGESPKDHLSKAARSKTFDADYSAWKPLFAVLQIQTPEANNLDALRRAQAEALYRFKSAAMNGFVCPKEEFLNLSSRIQRFNGEFRELAFDLEQDYVQMERAFLNEKSFRTSEDFITKIKRLVALDAQLREPIKEYKDMWRKIARTFTEHKKTYSDKKHVTTDLAIKILNNIVNSEPSLQNVAEQYKEVMLLDVKREEERIRKKKREKNDAIAKRKVERRMMKKYNEEVSVWNPVFAVVNMDNMNKMEKKFIMTNINELSENKKKALKIIQKNIDIPEKQIKKLKGCNQKAFSDLKDVQKKITSELSLETPDVLASYARFTDLMKESESCRVGDPELIKDPQSWRTDLLGKIKSIWPFGSGKK